VKEDDGQPDVEFGPRKAHSTPDNEKPPALHYDLDSSHIQGTFAQKSLYIIFWVIYLFSSISSPSIITSFVESDFVVVIIQRL
jgi:hypothetical protein